MTTPNPQTVRDFARRAILSTAEDVDFMGIAEQFSDDENWPADEDDAEAMHDAIDAERQTAIVTVSWPDEQQPADPVSGEQQQDGAAEDVTAFLDAWEADRGFGNAIRGGNGDIPYLFATDLRAVLAEPAARTARVAELEGEREAAAGFVAVWHDTANVQHEVDEIRCQSCRACVAGPLKSTTTLADLAVLAGRHECLPRMAATETEES